LDGLWSIVPFETSSKCSNVFSVRLLLPPSDAVDVYSRRCDADSAARYFLQLSHLEFCLVLVTYLFHTRVDEADAGDRLLSVCVWRGRWANVEVLREADFDHSVLGFDAE